MDGSHRVHSVNSVLLLIGLVVDCGVRWGTVHMQEMDGMVWRNGCCARGVVGWHVGESLVVVLVGVRLPV